MASVTGLVSAGRNYGGTKREHGRSLPRKLPCEPKLGCAIHRTGVVRHIVGGMIRLVGVAIGRSSEDRADVGTRTEWVAIKS
jgi:hypothetical protein